MAKKYVSLNSLIYLVQLLKTDFGTKVSYDDVINALDSIETTKPLSAAQGKALLDKIEEISTKGTAHNAANLGGLPAAKYVHTEDDGKIDSSVLPSYVDDVIEGYYHNGNFYEDEAHDKQIKAETGKIYVDLTNPAEPISYRYSGSVFTQIVSSDMVEITNDEINNIWSPPD